jgi:NADP-dependent 3-hydroxy acid dehydrogenase YdfG
VELPKLHLGEQYARALLAPLRADLAALERRTARQASRLKLRPEDQARMEAALRTVRHAYGEIDRLWETAGGEDD